MRLRGIWKSVTQACGGVGTSAGGAATEGRDANASLAVSAMAVAGIATAVVLLAGCSDDATAPEHVQDDNLEPAAATSAGVTGDSDRAALVALYEATDGPNWTDNTNWLTDAPLEDWYGVSLGSGGRVAALELSGDWDDENGGYVLHGLAGRLPPELGNLTSLEYLDLGVNDLTGPIPPEIGNLTRLEYLGLYVNNLTGKIPSEVGNLSGLTNFSLDDNSLTGRIPPELGNLSGLTVLAFYNNRLTGEIPPELGNLTNLEHLNLGFNRLTGQIPTELGELAALKVLILDTNLLYGSIPPELGSLPHLRTLDLSENRLLEGSIPPELGKLTSLERLNLGTTGVGGPLPRELGALSELEVLDLYASTVTGPIPAELGNLRNLERLDLAQNYLQGPIPLELGNLSSLRHLDLRYNEFLSGDIPVSLGNLRQLKTLHLDRNQLTGPIPPELGNLVLLESLDLHGNQLTGPIPPELGNLVLLRSLDLHRNQLTGPIPPELGNLEPLESLHLYANELSGHVPASLTNLVALRTLWIHNKVLSGPLPDSMGSLSQLEELWVANNPELSGPLPFDMADLAHLQTFKAGGTALCAPGDAALLEWLAGVPFHRVGRCEAPTAYLIQSIQSRTHPVPLIAGKPALLRAFVASPNANGEAMPVARAKLHLDGVEVEIEIDAATGTIPGSIEESEGSLERSINVNVPAALVQPGLEFVVDVDPAGTLDPALGVTGRIPATGRIAVEVVELRDLQLTVVPFLHDTRPDSSILDIAQGMADNPATHPMLAGARALLPVGGFDLELHDPVLTSDGFGIEILIETEMIRQIEGRPGYWLGMQGPVRLGLLGVAWDIPSWSSFSQPLPSTIAHEIGHNMGLFHAPCGGAGGPDPLYPHPTGLTNSWGYDIANGRLVSPHSPDLMSYCGGSWIGDYHHANALRHRMKTEVEAQFPPREPALVVWGGLDADGKPYLEPAFLTDAMPTLPPEGSDFTLRATTEGGGEAFVLRFDMPSTPDAEEGRTGFVFSVPVTWTGALESIVLLGRRHTAVLNRDTHQPFTILKDRATGQVRALLRRPMEVAADAMGAADYEVLYSTGIPDSN